MPNRSRASSAHRRQAYFRPASARIELGAVGTKPSTRRKKPRCSSNERLRAGATGTRVDGRESHA
jgi:hypothetical protein